MKTIYVIFTVLCAYFLAENPKNTPSVATQDGIKTSKKEIRTDEGRQRACGSNASWREIDEKTIQCVTKKNKPTFQVE